MSCDLPPALEPAPATPTIDDLARQHLRPLVRRIDREGFYPEAFLRLLGEAGGFAHHAHNPEGLREAIRITADIGAHCGSTAFLLWCQNTCVWYLAHTENASLREAHLDSLARGTLLGGTAFSNPMKCFSGIEPLRLKGRRTNAGIIVNGTLPWVSNLGPGHVFGTVVQVEDEHVCILAQINEQTIALGPSGQFAALEGTATYSIGFQDALITRDAILAAPADTFVDVIRPGFLLLQLGIAFGIARGALNDINRSKKNLAGINRFHGEQHENLHHELAALEEQADELAKTPLNQNKTYLQNVLELRLQAVEFVRRTAIAALEHAGAPGFLVNSAPQRRVREALFFGLLTPSGKQLRKMLGMILPQKNEHVGHSELVI